MTTIPPSTARKNDKWIPWYFVLFFAVIAMVDGTFVYMAITTHSGVVTKQSYKKGLSYNDTLAKADQQVQDGVSGLASYRDGYLHFTLHDNSANPVTTAQVTARIIRPVRDGYDFGVTLIHQNNGLYKAPLQTPLKGRWIAKVNADWQIENSANKDQDEPWKMKNHQAKIVFLAP